MEEQKTWVIVCVEYMCRQGYDLYKEEDVSFPNNYRFYMENISSIDKEEKSFQYVSKVMIDMQNEDMFTTMKMKILIQK
jgi:hypothetical protein